MVMPVSGLFLGFVLLVNNASRLHFPDLKVPMFLISASQLFTEACRKLLVNNFETIATLMKPCQPAVQHELESGIIFQAQLLPVGSYHVAPSCSTPLS